MVPPGDPINVGVVMTKGAEPESVGWTGEVIMSIGTSVHSDVGHDEPTDCGANAVDS